MSIASLLIAAVLLAAPVTVAAADEAEQYQALLEQKAPLIVTVRAVIKTEVNFGGQGQDQESRDEIQGVVVGKDGLIMVSFDSFRSRGEAGGDFQVKRTPQEIKVIFEREEKEYEAELVATDSKVNLAFLKVKDLEGRDVQIADFANPVSGEVGQKVAAVGRLEKGYDYAPYVRTAVVSGSIKKPRRALILDGSVRSEGLPVYSMDGAVIGVLTTLESGVREGSDEGGFFGMMSGGGRQFVLPGKVVAGMIQQARQQAAKAAEEAQAAQEDGDGD